MIHHAHVSTPPQHHLNSITKLPVSHGTLTCQSIGVQAASLRARPLSHLLCYVYISYILLSRPYCSFIAASQAIATQLFAKRYREESPSKSQTQFSGERMVYSHYCLRHGWWTYNNFLQDIKLSLYVGYTKIGEDHVFTVRDVHTLMKTSYLPSILSILWYI